MALVPRGLGARDSGFGTWPLALAPSSHGLTPSGVNGLHLRPAGGLLVYWTFFGLCVGDYGSDVLLPLSIASLSLRSRRRRSRDFDSFRRLLFSFFPVTGDLSLVSVSSFSISVSFKSVSRNALSTQRPPRPSSQRQDCSHSPLRCPRREQIPPPAWAVPGCC